MDGIAFFLDAPTTESWVQIAKQGRFKDPRYGTFSITQKDYDSWIKNFSVVNPPEGLPIDVDHGPEKRGNTEAAGWVKKIEQRGTELWAMPDWNSLGKQLIEDRRYLYLSPSYHPHFKDEKGVDHGTALVGVGLTNRPFLSMATISLSKGVGEFAVEEPVSDSPSRMELSANILKALGLGEDVTDEQKVLDTITEMAKEPEAAEPKSLDDLAKAENKVVLDAAAVQDLVVKANKGEAAAKELDTMRFDTAWSLALDQGKAVPAQKDSFVKLYELDRETTLKMLDDLQPVVNITAVGSGGNSLSVGGVTASEFALDSTPMDNDRLDVHNRAVALSVDRKIDYIDAVALIQRGEA